MIEIATIFGVKRMKQIAYLHGTSFESNIPTIGANGFALGKIVLWSTCRTEHAGTGETGKLSPEEEVAIRFLDRCLELDPNKRISAEEALQHEFLAESITDYEDEDEMQML
jgi:cell division control protein 7